MVWATTLSVTGGQSIIAHKGKTIFTPFQALAKNTASAFASIEKQWSDVKVEVKKINKEFESGMIKTYEAK